MNITKINIIVFAFIVIIVGGANMARAQSIADRTLEPNGSSRIEHVEWTSPLSESATGAQLWIESSGGSVGLRTAAAGVKPYVLPVVGADRTRRSDDRGVTRVPLKLGYDLDGLGAGTYYGVGGVRFLFSLTPTHSEVFFPDEGRFVRQRVLSCPEGTFPDYSVAGRTGDIVVCHNRSSRVDGPSMYLPYLEESGGSYFHQRALTHSIQQESGSWTGIGNTAILKRGIYDASSSGMVLRSDSVLIPRIRTIFGSGSVPVSSMYTIGDTVVFMKKNCVKTDCSDWGISLAANDDSGDFTIAELESDIDPSRGISFVNFAVNSDGLGILNAWYTSRNDDGFVNECEYKTYKFDVSDRSFDAISDTLMHIPGTGIEVLDDGRFMFPTFSSTDPATCSGAVSTWVSVDPVNDFEATRIEGAINGYDMYGMHGDTVYMGGHRELVAFRGSDWSVERELTTGGLTRSDGFIFSSEGRPVFAEVYQAFTGDESVRFMAVDEFDSSGRVVELYRNDFSDGTRFDYPTDVLLDADNEKMWISNRGSSNIVSVDPKTGAVLLFHDIEIPSGFFIIDLLHVDASVAVLSIWGNGPITGLIYDLQTGESTELPLGVITQGSTVTPYGVASYIVSQQTGSGHFPSGSNLVLEDGRWRVKSLHASFSGNQHVVLPEGGPGHSDRVVVSTPFEVTVAVIDGDANGDLSARRLTQLDLPFRPTQGTGSGRVAYLFGAAGEIAVISGDEPSFYTVNGPCNPQESIVAGDELYFACSDATYRLNASGAITQVYSHPSETPRKMSAPEGVAVAVYTSDQGEYPDNRVRVLIGGGISATYDFPATALDFIRPDEPVGVIEWVDEVIIRSELIVSSDDSVAPVLSVLGNIKNPLTSNSFKFNFYNLKYELAVFDVLGRLIGRGVGEGTVNLPVPGTYIAVVRLDGEIVETRLLTAVR